MNKLATKIQTFRVEKAWTQDKLATEMGVSKQSVSFWETGRSNPGIRYLAKLSALTGYPVEDMVRWKMEDKAARLDAILGRRSS